MAFLTAYYNRPSVDAECQKDRKSIVEPGQTVPLSKIITGLRNGTIILPESNPQYDIPEKEIDVPAQRTPEATNAAIADAAVKHLSETADSFPADITRRPGFDSADAEEFFDSIAAVIANKPNGEVDGEQPAAPQSKAGDKPKSEPLGGNNDADAA